MQWALSRRSSTGLPGCPLGAWRWAGDTWEGFPTGDEGLEEQVWVHRKESRVDLRNIVATSVLLRKRLPGGHRDFLGSNIIPGAVIGAAHSPVHGFFHLLTSRDSFVLALLKNA